MIIRKGNRCFDAITNKEAGCPPMPIPQVLGNTVLGGFTPPGGVIPPIGGGVITPPPGGGGACCLSTSCPLDCTSLNFISGCLLGKLKFGLANQPIPYPTLEDLIATFSPTPCGSYFNTLVGPTGAFSTITNMSIGPAPTAPGFYYSVARLSGSPRCADMYISIKWEYRNTFANAGIQIKGVKICSSPGINQVAYDACADCTTTPSTGCIPDIRVSFGPSRWRDSTLTNRTLPVDETDTYIDVFIAITVAYTPCTVGGTITITQAPNCGNAVLIPAPIVIPAFSTAMFFRVKWDTTCLPCPGPYPNYPFKVYVATTTNPVPTLTNFPIPFGFC